ncbi:hypothetical protein [Psychrobium sp. 1_MG-2023]|uniref:hypothetical protein n=1 Tax=Psychrobium sp. 1_MG-2023 TaxID=3062624 RepID=UPI001290FF24|nr:hypothetical protein [Psychrobium sp. 1_MG-2023]MDP2562693.1 hypothetical protein [Psychrobium sp. 1_MG-2023]
MTLQFLAILLTVIGAGLTYLSNKNQRLIATKLVAKWAYSGISLMLISFALWLQLFSGAVAFFIWVFTSAMALTIIPLLSLLKRTEAN